MTVPLTVSRVRELLDYDPVRGALVWKASIGKAQAAYLEAKRGLHPGCTI